MRLPAAVFYPMNDTSKRAVLVEVFSEDMQESEIRSILVNRYKRQDVLCVLCYAADVHRGLMLKVIREIKAQEKIVFYRMPARVEASALVELDAELVGDALTNDITTFTEEEQESLGRVVMCAYQFEVASVRGIADYLEMEGWFVAELSRGGGRGEAPQSGTGALRWCPGLLGYRGRVGVPEEGGAHGIWTAIQHDDHRGQRGYGSLAYSGEAREAQGLRAVCRDESRGVA